MVQLLNGFIGATAALFLASYISVYYRHWFTKEKTPENWTALQLHLSIGVTGVIVCTSSFLENYKPEPSA